MVPIARLSDCEFEVIESPSAASPVSDPDEGGSRGGDERRPGVATQVQVTRLRAVLGERPKDGVRIAGGVQQGEVEGMMGKCAQQEQCDGVAAVFSGDQENGTARRGWTASSGRTRVIVTTSGDTRRSARA